MTTLLFSELWSFFPPWDLPEVEASRRGVGGVTHSAALRVVGSVGQDEGPGLQGTLAVNRAEGRVPTAGQDHEEMCRDGRLIPGQE